MAYTQMTSRRGTVRQDMIRRNADGASIPNDPENRDWQEYQDWIAQGNEPDPPPDADAHD